MILESVTNLQAMNVKKAFAIAVESQCLEIVKLFSMFRVDLNSLCYKKKTPLYIACETGNVEITGLIIDRFETAMNL